MQSSQTLDLDTLSPLPLRSDKTLINRVINVNCCVVIYFSKANKGRYLEQEAEFSARRGAG